MLVDLMLFLLLGISSGLMAGLLGIGGGVIVVPILASFFTFFHLQSNLGMHYAAGTSFGIMIFTTLSSIRQHKAYGHIIWPMVIRMLPWVILGTFAGAIAARMLHSNVLSFVFSLFLLVMSANMALNLKKYRYRIRKKINKRAIRTMSVLIGISSGLFGVGGGTLSVPYLRHCGLSIKRASGSSAFLTLPIAICGFFLFLILGLSHHDLSWATGYIYWPAVLCIAPLSIIFANVGARLNYKLSPHFLQIAFAILLCVLGIKMFWLSISL